MLPLSFGPGCFSFVTYRRSMFAFSLDASFVTGRRAVAVVGVPSQGRRSCLTGTGSISAAASGRMRRTGFLVRAMTCCATLPSCRPASTIRPCVVKTTISISGSWAALSMPVVGSPTSTRSPRPSRSSRLAQASVVKSRPLRPVGLTIRATTSAASWAASTCATGNAVAAAGEPSHATRTFPRLFAFAMIHRRTTIHPYVARRVGPSIPTETVNQPDRSDYGTVGSGSGLPETRELCGISDEASATRRRRGGRVERPRGTATPSSRAARTRRSS